jgi:voltage-gated potassium channel
MNPLNKLRRFWIFLKKENLFRLLFVLTLLILISTLGLQVFEPETSLKNAFWWSIVTLTTVGYGDITPTSAGGRIIGIIIMFFGIGILGMFTATIASIFVEKKMKEDRGMKSLELNDHIIICEWNFRTREILKELRSDPRMEVSPVVLIANIERKPVEDEFLYFIRGDVTEENLDHANIKKAKTVVILGDDKLDDNARDAKVVLSTLTVESLRPEVYTIAELVNESNVIHCQRAKADEIIVSSEFSSRLISRATLDHGISKVVSELLSTQYGNELYKMAVKEDMIGKKFIDIFSECKRKNNSIVLAIQKGEEGKVISNPSSEHLIEPNDYLIIISETRP